MLENILSVFRKRRRMETDNSTYSDTPAESVTTESPSNYLNDATASNLPTWAQRPMEFFFDSQPPVEPSLQQPQQDQNITSIYDDRPYKYSERFVTILDRLDARVEMFRKDALSLQEKKDYLLTSMDLIKNHESLQMMSESDREEIMCYMQRVNARLGTVELNVRTVRDRSQEDSLSQINALIDAVIKMSDAVEARQRCKQYLNSCCSSTESGGGANLTILPESQALGGVIDLDVGPVDKKFESALLGCTLDDQKTIKKRLQALMNYLNKQIIRD